MRTLQRRLARAWFRQRMADYPGPIGMLGMARDRYRDLTDETHRQEVAFRKLADSNVAAATRLVDALKAQGAETGHLEAILKDTVGTQSRLNADQQRSAEIVGGLTTTTAAFTMSAEDAEAALSRFNDTIRTLIGASFSVQEALDTMERDYIRLTESIQANGTALAGNSAQVLANREALRGIVERVAGVIQAQAEAGASSDHLARSLQGQTQRFVDNLTQLGFNRQEVQGYAEVLRHIPTNVSTSVTADTAAATAAINNLRKLIGLGGTFVTTPGGVRAFAEGGLVKRPTLAMIGEAGPELVLPLNDARRMSELLRESAAAGGASLPAFSGGAGGASTGGNGSTVNNYITVNAGVGDPVAIGEQVRRVLARGDRRGVSR